MYKYFNGLLPILMLFSQNFLIFIIMTQETNHIIILLEIKRSVLTKQLDLWDQSYGTLQIKNIKNAISTKHFWKLYKSSLISSYT